MLFNPKKKEDFLLNEYFIQWATHPDKESDRFWQKWMRDHPEKAIMLKQAKEGIASFKPVEYTMDESVNEQILNNILIHHQKKGTEKPGGKRKFLFKLPSLPVAASIALLFSLLASLLYLFPLDQHKEKASPAKWMVKTTKSGAKMSFQLPDGSLVKLNTNSSLEFPAEFSDSIREVRITGEAFFEVKHLENLPFIVHSNGLKVKVLGTTFNVRNYPNEGDQKVALVTGKVSINTNEGLHEVLNPLEMITYSKAKKEMVKENFDPAFAIGWKDGIIQFKNTPFPEVFKVLERWYGVEFYISKEIRFKGGFNGKFQNESLENVLKGMSFSEGFRFQINGKKILIFK